MSAATTATTATTTAAPAPADASATGGLRSTGDPNVAVTRRAFGATWKGAVVMALVFGATAASSAVSYVSTFPTEASRADLSASLSGDAGFTALFGQVTAIGTVGGYTVYKTFVFLTTIGAVWAILAGTRLLRGEEDAGRWQLLLAGRTSPARATAATLVGLAVSVGVVFVGTTVLVAMTGAKPDVGFGAVDCIVYGLSVAAAPAVFGALATVCAQLAQTRRLATGLGVAVFGVFFVLRMIGDSGPGASWLLWATPLGWIEKVEPFTANDLWPLVPALLVTVAAGLAAVALAARRDAGAGAIASHDVRPLRASGLRTPIGLAARLNLPVLLGWTVGVVATSFLMGIVTKSVASALTESSGTTNALTQLGASAASSGALQYLGAVFLLTGGVLALAPASQIGPARDEEASGRLSQVLAGTPTRAGWLTGRLVVAAVAVIIIGVLAGVTGWLGAASQGLTLDFGTMLAAGINIVPAALLALGIGAIALAVVPRFATIVVYAVVGWSLIIDLLGSLITGLDSLTKASIFHYVALAPSTDPDWTALAIMTALALVLCSAAVAIFARRDLSLD